MRILNLQKDYANAWLKRSDNMHSGGRFLYLGESRVLDTVPTRCYFEVITKNKQGILSTTHIEEFTTHEQLKSNGWVICGGGEKQYLSLVHIDKDNDKYRANSFVTDDKDNNIIFTRFLNLTNEEWLLTCTFGKLAAHRVLNNSIYFYMTNAEFQKTKLIMGGYLKTTARGNDCIGFVSVPKTAYYVHPNNGQLFSCATGNPVDISEKEAMTKRHKKFVTMDDIISNEFWKMTSTKMGLGNLGGVRK